MLKKLVLVSVLLGISMGSYADGIINLLQSKEVAPSLDCVQKDDVKKCDLYLDESIKDPQDYILVTKEIRRLTESDTLTLHLAGNGGSGAGLVYLLNAIRYSKVYTIGSLEGSVASAHTILLVAADEIQINGDGYLLFHSISSSNMIEDICVNTTGKDRGIAMYTKCVEDLTKQQDFYGKLINPLNTKYLTPDEIKQYETGHDVIISSDVFKKRLKG
jgi:ATP-dependent protease ClpP protease subunit